MAKKQAYTKQAFCTDLGKVKAMAPGALQPIVAKLDVDVCEAKGRGKKTAVLSEKQCKNDLRVFTTWWNGRKEKQGIPADFASDASKRIKCALNI